MLPGFPLCRPRHAPARGGRRRRTLALPGASLSTAEPGVSVRWLRATDLPLPPTMRRRSAARPPPMARPRSEAQRGSMAHPPSTAGRRSTAARHFTAEARMAAARRISRWADRMAAAGLTEPRCASERGLAMRGGRPAERRFTVGEAAANPSLGAIARCSRTGSSNPSPEPVSRENSPSSVEKPRFPAGVRAGASGAVDRDAQGPATSRGGAEVSLSGEIPVPHCRRCGSRRWGHRCQAGLGRSAFSNTDKAQSRDRLKQNRARSVDRAKPAAGVSVPAACRQSNRPAGARREWLA